MSDSLFSTRETIDSSAPLADRMRPRNLDEFVGQEHIVGEGCLLRRAIIRDRLSSIILSGPPGTGKTTLARVIANTTEARFVAINAVLAGVQAIRDAIASAQKDREFYSRKTILFVDEVHRWNKAQQDSLLPWIENGTIILIGATTENPYFEVNKALVSRSRVFQLNSLTNADLEKTLNNALADKARGYGNWRIEFEKDAFDHLIKTANGDARTLLNAIELAVETSVDTWPPEHAALIHVSMSTAEQSIQKRAVLYDRDGDYHYDSSSALIKSIRGSDPDAALYWLAKMVYSGEDPRFLFRRLLISASEDIGLADPNAVVVTEACTRAFEQIGMPEGQYLLAQAILYLATAPKSNSCSAFFEAMAAVEKERTEVPKHLRPAGRGSEQSGHGEGYILPHDSKDHWVAQQYMPEALRFESFYRPGSLGYEASLRESVESRRDAQIASYYASLQEDGANDTDARTVPNPGQKTQWQKRADSVDADAYLGLHKAILAAADIKPDENILLPNADDSHFLRQASRNAPEGRTVAVLSSEESLRRMELVFSSTERHYRPVLRVHGGSDLGGRSAVSPWAGMPKIGCIMACDAIRPNAPAGSSDKSIAAMRECLNAFPHARAVLAQRIPASSGILPSLAADAIPQELFTSFLASDASFFDAERKNVSGILMQLLRDAGKDGSRSRLYLHRTSRTLTEREISLWLSAESRYGSYLERAIGPAGMMEIRDSLKRFISDVPVAWPLEWEIAIGGQAPELAVKNPDADHS